MATWTRTSIPVACGGCGQEIPAGFPVARVTAAQRPRCLACARRLGLPDPAGDLPRETRPAPPPAFSAVAALAQSFRLKKP